jgi:NADP-dependent aldehyde dehydrogenase
VSELSGLLASTGEASGKWSAWSRSDRADVIDRLADALDEAKEELVAVADSETALGAGRLGGEVGRTTGQLRMFGDVLRDGAYVDAVISPARPDVGQPDVRRMLQPIGPVAVFAASNFPFAFSVAGGDTASALAAGCAVVVKAHEAHPSTSVRTADIVTVALRTAGAPDGLFTLVHGRAAGSALVTHPGIKAVGFTGSRSGGRALFDLSVGRPDPIPFFGELGSSNPVIVLPAAAADDPERIAREYVDSLTLGSGQFCTNPGLLFVPDDASLLSAISAAVPDRGPGTMLTSTMRDAYVAGIQAFSHADDVDALASGGNGQSAGWQVGAHVFKTSSTAFAAQEDLRNEVFGPAGLIVTYGSLDELWVAVSALEGSLAAAVQAAASELPLARQLIDRLRAKTGRIILNGWPTGVAVVWAMHHGGPWPATTASRDTSVGARAIQRWLTPIAYQDCPDALLPRELQSDGLPERARTVQA